MLELHQFRHSAFCEKVRLLLAAKRLPYSVVEVVPGIGQLQLYRLSGQRQVPVLVDGPAVIADSSAIALHLEQRQPEPALLPVDPARRAEVLLLEDWADTALAAGARLALVQAQPYLVGEQLTLADLAVMAQLSLLKFPQCAGAPLAGLGVPGLADDPQLQPLWRWRDRLGVEVGRP